MQQLTLDQASALARFEDKVQRDPETGCWEWLGYCLREPRGESERGYGQFGFQGRVVQAHRFAYEVFVGPVPEGLQLDHLCRSRSCVNPSHLEAVTASVNSRRSPRCNRTHCPRGHPYNRHSYIDPRGRRDCRICKRHRGAESKKKRRLLASTPSLWSSPSVSRGSGSEGGGSRKISSRKEDGLQSYEARGTASYRERAVPRPCGPTKQQGDAGCLPLADPHAACGFRRPTRTISKGRQ